MPLVTKTKNIKAENVSYVKTDFGETSDGKKFSKDYFKYNHGEKDGGTVKGAATFKADFEITFPAGLYFETSENSKYKKLQGKAQLDMGNKKVRSFADSPKRGLKSGWVHVKDVESVEFNTLKAKKKIPVYAEASDDEKSGEIEEGTILTSDSKDDEFFHVTYGGGERGMLHELRRGVAKALYKNRKAAGLKVKSEKELEELIKFPIYFHTDDDGNETDRASWYLKITYKEGKDGWLAKFEVPGVRELTLEEMMNNRITGRPCFRLQSLYRGGTNRSMQIFLSSMVVTDFAPIEYTSAQQDDIDELGNDPEFVERMKGLVPVKPPTPPPKGKKSGKKKEKKKSSAKKNDSDDDSDKDEADIKGIIAPSLEKVDVDDDDSESDDEPAPGIEKAKASEKKDDDSDDDSDEDEKPSPKETKETKEKKKPAPKKKVETDSDDDSSDSD